MLMRIGQGFDAHTLVPGRPLVLGGVNIDYPLGLLGHSDADVLVHAIMDALLGACALGDIGGHFPPDDPRYEGADSMVLLKRVGEMVRQSGNRVVNIDATIVAERPRLAPYLGEMAARVAKVLTIPPSCVSVKATTTEKMGFTGREEGIAALAVCLVERTGGMMTL